MMIRKLPFYSILLALALSQTACMKTRAQIKAQNASADAAEDPATAPIRRDEMEEVKSELTRLSGKLEEVEHAQRSNNVAEVKEYSTRLDARIAELEKNQILIMTELKDLKDRKAEAQAAAKEAATPSKDLLGQANQLLAQKKYEDAAEKFKTVLSKSPKPKEAADAHFGLGEAEYGQKNYKKAIVQYSKVQEVNAKSNRVPSSLYKIGMAFQHLNMPKESKGFFAELIERYPKSAEAKKARAKVKE